MSHRSLAATLAFAVLSTTVASAAETLTMKFEAGETFGYLITQDMTMSGNAQGRDFSFQMMQTLSLSTNVKSVEEDGSAKVDQKIDRVQMKMILPDSRTIEHDTATGEEPDDPQLKQMAENLSKMVGAAIGMTIAPHGELTDIEVPDEVKESQQAPGSPMAGAGQLEQMFKQSGLRLPRGEISEGHKWDQKMEMKLPFGTMEITTNYVYGGKNDEGLHKIDATMDIDLKQPEDAEVSVEAEAKRASGTFLFDNKAGRLTRSEVTQELEMTIGGLAKQNITTIVTMQLSDGSEANSNRE